MDINIEKWMSLTWPQKFLVARVIMNHPSHKKFLPIQKRTTQYEFLPPTKSMNLISPTLGGTL